MAQFIGERQREMAIRAALGATDWNLVTLVATHTGRLVGVGIALGVVTAGATTRVLRALLFNISATDATSFALTVFVFLTMAALASYIQARRAMRGDPMGVLRSE